MQKNITIIVFNILLCFGATYYQPVHAQTTMINIDARHCTNLNGQWQAIIDPSNTGEWRRVWEEREPEGKTDFVEYAFEGNTVLNVPGDFNTQQCELTYYEGIVWYKKTFDYTLQKGKRLFLHFGAVNYRADVYLNGQLLGSHEGGFTPFQFEITEAVKPGENTLVVKVDNRRQKDGIPGLGYDWLNYGGITRDVNLIETNRSFIEDYFIQLKKQSPTEIHGSVTINGTGTSQTVSVQIPELDIDYHTKSDDSGKASVSFRASPELWSPQNPKLYKVIVACETDTVTEAIGFRNIAVEGTEIYLNGQPIFLKGVNIHEEMPLRGARAFSESDALVLLTWAKELGCNMVRLAHYPHNRHMVKLAEKMGLMIWNELPVYQHIAFSSPDVLGKMDRMMREMINRDKNRAAVIIWCLSNETYPSTPGRDVSLKALTKQCRQLDSTRLITSVANTQRYENHTMRVWDSIYAYSDFIALNEYLGWYEPWQGLPKETKWELAYDKPVVISEFGGEALYGSNYGPKDEAAHWREEYQEQIYNDQIAMFGNTPNLAGVCPWLLVDYRSPGRMHPVYQRGWNRKGLLSDRGEKKKAWYVLKAFFESIENH